MAEETGLNRKYLGALVVAAIAIIMLGLMARRALVVPGAPQTAPPSEASTLQRLTQENQLRSISVYINERIAAIAPQVVRVPARGASGIKWGDRDSVISTSPDRPVLLVQPVSSDSLRPPFALDSDSVRRDWVLVVGRDPGERVVSWYGMSGGRSYGRCGGRIVDKYVLGVPLTPELSGAGVFDLAGRLRGMIVDCGDGYAAVTGSELRRLLADTAGVTPGDPAGADTTGVAATSPAR